MQHFKQTNHSEAGCNFITEYKYQIVTILSYYLVVIEAINICVCKS